MVIGYSIYGPTKQNAFMYSIKENYWTKSHFPIILPSESDGNGQLYVINLLQQFYVVRTICCSTNHSIEIYHYMPKSNSWKYLYSNKYVPLCDLHDLILI